MKHYNTAYPLSVSKGRRPNQRRNPKPWILPWLEDACSRKNEAYLRLQLNYTDSNLALYLKLKKFCHRHVVLAKAKYYKKYFNDHRENSAKQWKMINKLLNRGMTEKTTIQIKNENGELVTNSTKIAELFNSYFSNIAANLKFKSNSINGNPAHALFLRNPVARSMVVYPTSEAEVSSTINKLKNKATLDTRIHALKIANQSPKFVSALTNLINLSFAQGKFPTALKLAKVSPIYKGGSKNEVSNYRPISLLSSISKIFEKIMHCRLLNFLDSNSSLFEGQYGFRPARSCEHALLNAKHSILEALNKKQTALLLLIDFSKAFDMVDHKILLNKLAHYGIRGIALDWFKSYLQDRKQYVAVNGKTSDEHSIKFGVPQGSILGPLLFIIYINDLPGICDLATWVMYADDANIIVYGDSFEEAHQKIVALANKLTEWVDCNGLALNLKKTKHMIFTRNRLSKSQTNTPLVIKGIEIEKCSETRFLGVIMDEKLTWATHIAAIKSKMAMFTGILYRLKSTLPLKVRLAIYHSFIQSHLNFCSLVWGFAAKSHIDSLFRKQKAGIRAVMPGQVTTHYNEGLTPTHTKPFFTEHKILTVQNLIAKNAVSLLLKSEFCSQKVPLLINEPFSKGAPHLSDSTCEDTHYWTEKYHQSSFQKSVFYKGPLLRNDPRIITLIFDKTSEIRTIRSHSKATKRALLILQAAGSELEWETLNFPIHAIKGIRSSNRLANTQENKPQ